MEFCSNWVLMPGHNFSVEAWVRFNASVSMLANNYHANLFMCVSEVSIKVNELCSRVSRHGVTQASKLV